MASFLASSFCSSSSAACLKVAACFASNRTSSSFLFFPCTICCSREAIISIFFCSLSRFFFWKASSAFCSASFCACSMRSWSSSPCLFFSEASSIACLSRPFMRCLSSLSCCSRANACSSMIFAACCASSRSLRSCSSRCLSLMRCTWSFSDFHTFNRSCIAAFFSSRAFTSAAIASRTFLSSISSSSCRCFFSSIRRRWTSAISSSRACRSALNFALRFSFNSSCSCKNCSVALVIIWASFCRSSRCFSFAAASSNTWLSSSALVRCFWVTSVVCFFFCSFVRMSIWYSFNLRHSSTGAAYFL
mmetsp:Transcript_27999/g.64558  ORF Transcript_27999/g.64558 Transcript_27999/m.64558 type:complete len:304 (+) Transcript_27999:429-1340(+)